MNKDQLRGKILQLDARLRARWARFTNDERALLRARAEELLGVLRERYGTLRAALARRVGAWARQLDARLEAAHSRGAEAPGEKARPSAPSLR